jgi:hypothetical protein
MVRTTSLEELALVEYMQVLCIIHLLDFAVIDKWFFVTVL